MISNHAAQITTDVITALFFSCESCKFKVFARLYTRLITFHEYAERWVQLAPEGKGVSYQLC